MVVPDDSAAGGRAKRAAREYVKFAGEATGTTVGYLQENQFSDENKNFISIGETSLLSKANFGLDISKLGDSGYIIKSDEKGNIYIIGGDIQNGWMGLMCGVYDLLHEFFGYEYYSDGVYSLTKNVTSAEFLEGELDKTVLPSFEYRVRGCGFNAENSVDGELNAYRLRMNSPYTFSFGNLGMHDIFGAIPYSEYGSAHNIWYTDDKKQVCFGRDPDGIADVIVQKILSIVTAAENNNSELKDLEKLFYVGMADSTVWCDCSTCAAYINAHGGYKVSTYINFINKVAGLLKSRNRTDIKPVMLAYHATQDAPVKVNGNGSYSLISADMKLDDNVVVYYCPIEANYYVPFGDDSDGTGRNVAALKNLKGWNVVADKVMYYFYMENFPNYYMNYFDVTGSIRQNFKYAAENGGFSMYNLGQFNESVSSGFSRYKEYLSAKLMWNVNENIDELTDNFFANYYGVAGDIMKGIFNEYRAMLAEKFKSYKNLGSMSIYCPTLNANYFDRAKLKEWLADIDSAYTTVENSYKAGNISETEKSRLIKAIKTESMFLRAIVIEYFGNYADTISGKTLSALKTEWKDDALELKMTMWAEHETLEDHYKKW